MPSRTPGRPLPTRTALTLGALLTLASCTFGGAAGGPQGPAGGMGPLEGEPPSGLDPMVDSIPLPAGVLLDTIRSRLLDYGKLWTFEAPPLEHLRQTHGFVPDTSALRHLRLSALRIPGCSASLVSPHGLVLTNHHCVRNALERVSLPGEDLLKDGFGATSLADERRVEGIHADRLVAIEDVTDEVERRMALAPASLRAERREEIHAEIRQRLSDLRGGADAGVVVEVVPLFRGARTSAYVYARHEDVRLVMVPELSVAFFGGDPDNFTYPRHTLDFAFLRVYGDDGAPLASDPYLGWSTVGASEDELVLTVGSPGATHRFETVEQLRFRRDVSDRALLDFVRRRAGVFEAFVRERPELASRSGVESALFDLQNSVKSYEGQLAGFADPVVVARLRDREAAFRREIEADSLLRERFGDLFESLAQLQARRRQNGAGYTFLALGSTAYEAATLNRALIAFQYASALRQALPIRARNALLDELRSIPDKPAELEEALIQDRLEGFVEAFGVGSPLALEVLDGRSAEGAASHLRQSSVFADSARTAEVARSGIVPMDDPAIRVVQAYLPALSRFEQLRVQADAQEAVLSEQIGRAHFAVHGARVAPDATFSPRLSDGVVRGYVAGGVDVPPFTTLQGMFDRHAENRGRYTPPSASPWDLPERWLEAYEALDRTTPLNFVSTVDFFGGSSGSPVVNRDLELVGVIFDGNQESLPGSYIHLTERGRAIAVDVRAILESLQVVYEMEALVTELDTGQLSGAGAGTGAAPTPR
jgi:hypothetical protein